MEAIPSPEPAPPESVELLPPLKPPPIAPPVLSVVDPVPNIPLAVMVPFIVTVELAIKAKIPPVVPSQSFAL